jgi:PadR family transcriptional regulator, regulatory protein PadR
MSKHISDEAPVGSFEEQVMLAVIRTGAEAYGMVVRRELESVTERAVTIGSVYITLDRLEAKGLVASARSAARNGSSSRRIFSVTPRGIQALEETRSIRDRLWNGVTLRHRLRQA